MEIEHLNLLGGFKKLRHCYFYLFIALVFKSASFKIAKPFTFYFCSVYLILFSFLFSYLCIPPNFLQHLGILVPSAKMYLPIPAKINTK